jgi:ATPase subunit of ABC transporter with duplicated ATPase domains
VLASLIASAKNLLILDEPTNHLDIPSAERLEEALDKFGDIDKSRIGGKGGHGGVLLLISHDRALLDDVCDKLVILDGEGNSRVFDGTYREWEAKVKAEKAEAAERARKSATKPQQKPAPATAPAPHAAARATPNATPKPSSQLKKKSRFSNLPIEKIEQRIAEIGRELREIDQSFSDPKIASDATRTKKLLSRRDELGGEQEELEAEWLRKSEA